MKYEIYINFTFNYQNNILQVSARIEQNVNFQEQLSILGRPEVPSICSFFQNCFVIDFFVSFRKKSCHCFFLKIFVLKKCSTKPQRPTFTCETRHLHDLTLYKNYVKILENVMFSSQDPQVSN